MTTYLASKGSSGCLQNIAIILINRLGTILLAAKTVFTKVKPEFS